MNGRARKSSDSGSNRQGITAASRTGQMLLVKLIASPDGARHRNGAAVLFLGVPCSTADSRLPPLLPQSIAERLHHTSCAWQWGMKPHRSRARFVASGTSGQQKTTAARTKGISFPPAFFNFRTQATSSGDGSGAQSSAQSRRVSVQKRSSTRCHAFRKAA